MTKSKRPPEPDFVAAWREWIKAGPPRCCHTCEHYSIHGSCVVFDMTPPPEFAAMPDQCETWTQELPF